ncbi:TldD/PmbA family protein [[Eubacterium] cellulosolvens]
MDEAVKYGAELGAGEVAAAVTRERRKMLRFANNSVTVVQSWDQTVPTVYMTLKRKRAGARVEDPSVEALKEVMKTLKAAMDITKPGEVEAALPRGPFTYERVPETYDGRIPAMTYELADVAEEAINAALAEGARRSSGTVLTSEWERYVKTSAGGEGRDKGTNIELSIRAFVTDDSSGQGNSCATRLEDFNPTSAGAEAGKTANQARNPVFGDEGKYTVLLGPAIMAEFLSRTADFASAYSVDLGLSFLAGRIGQNVASEKLTLIDDRRFPGGINSCSLDDEGYPTQRTAIIERGVLKTYLHSSYSVAKYGGELTGSAFYVGGTWGIAPVALNVIVEPGEYREDELYEQVKDGLYLTNTWYTRFQNYQIGDFSSICRDGAFQIKNGRIERSLKGLRISDNMPRILQSIVSLSRERKWIKWWEVPTPVYLPHTVVEDVGITKATK